MDRIKKHGEFFYFMSEAELEHLAQAKGWLAERVKACEESAGASRDRVCADTVLTVRSTTKSALLKSDRIFLCSNYSLIGEARHIVPI